MKTIPLSNGGEVSVDDADYSFLSQFSWRKKISDGSGNYHVVRDVNIGGRRMTVRMHRLITEADVDDRVIFLNGNGMDCRRKNLAKRQLKPWSGRPYSSGYRGVKQLGTNKYRAEVEFAGRVHVIGVDFANSREAAMAYDGVVRTLFGNQARTNF